MPERTFTHPLFGPVRFRTASATWVRGDKITFISGFDTNDIQPVQIPQLVQVPGSSAGNLRFHRRAHAQVLMAFADIERQGLLRHIKTCAGSLNFRLKKPTSGALSKEPSNHAFGIAIDLNADDGSLGASVAPVAPVFKALGFRWGIEFNDPMHFEVKTFIDHPRSIGTRVAAFVNAQPAELGAMNLMGQLVVDLAKASAPMNVSTVTESGARAKVAGPAATRSLPIQRLGDVRYVSLALLAGVANLEMFYDNDAKIVTLVTAGA